MKKYAKWIIVVLVVLIALIFYILQRYVWLPEDGEVIFDDPTQSLIKVHVLDVGQADSIVIELPGHRTMMIDIGTADRQDQINAYLDKLLVKKVDYLVLSHLHSDHIGDFEEWLDTCAVSRMYIPETNAGDGAAVMRYAESRGVTVESVRAGTVILDENDLKIEVLAPLRPSYENENDGSVVVKVTYVNNKFLFMSDASTLSENEMMAYGYDVDADVIKIPHHGSASSNSETFLRAVSPDYAVISVGEDNAYELPSADVNKRLSDMKIKTYRTDRDGTVVFLGNGQRIAVKTEK